MQLVDDTPRCGYRVILNPGDDRVERVYNCLTTRDVVRRERIGDVRSNPLAFTLMSSRSIAG